MAAMSSRGSAPISAEAVRRDPLAALRRRERGVVGRKAAVLESVYQLTRKPGMDHEKRLAAQVRPLTGTMRRPMASIRLTRLSAYIAIYPPRENICLCETLAGQTFLPTRLGAPARDVLLRCCAQRFAWHLSRCNYRADDVSRLCLANQCWPKP